MTASAGLHRQLRDFAIAAGIASAAFGAAAAAPLGLYGIVVLVWGTAVAGRLRPPPTATTDRASAGGLGRPGPRRRHHRRNRARPAPFKRGRR